MTTLRLPYCGVFSASLLLVIGASRSVLADPVDLAALKGWDVVVSPTASPSEQYAAREFQEFYAQASGLRLPIVAKCDRPDRHVFIGPSPELLASAVGFDAAKMPAEDFRLVVRDDLIAIAGGPPRGTLYGVYQFLEDQLGVRFLTFDHTYVPALPPSPRLVSLDSSIHPPLAFRWSYYGENHDHPEFATRLRNNTIAVDPKLGGKTGRQLISHSFGDQIPSQKFGADHPEYYALRDGKRLANVKDDWSETEPCLTNPEVLKIVTARVLEQIKANPGAENISVSQNDNDKFCLCPKCKELDDQEKSPMGSLLTFVNAVAEKVEPIHPNVKVGTLAYWYSRRPPLTIVPRKNVQIQLCSIECCLTHSLTDPDCALNGPFRDDLRRWGEICDDVSIWNYNTNFSSYQLPNPNLWTIEPNVRYFVENHARGVFMQAAGNTTGAEFSDLRNYLISRLLWNPQLKGAEIIDEFLDLHYGPAAPPIRAFIQQVYDEAAASGKHRNCFGNLEGRGLTPGLGDRGVVLFDEALRLATDDAQRRWIEKASLCAYRAAIEPTWVLRGDAKPDAALAARQRPLVKKFFELCQKHGVAMVSERKSVGDRLKEYKRLFGLGESESL